MSKIDLKNSLGLITGLGSDPFNGSAIEIAITSFAAFDPKAADRVNAIRDGRLRTKKMQDFFHETTEKSDPVLSTFAYGDRLKGTGLHFFFGDENQDIEAFIDENKKSIDQYLEKINRHAIGGFTFSSEEDGLEATPAAQDLFQHLQENYFNIDDI